MEQLYAQKEGSVSESSTVLHTHTPDEAPIRTEPAVIGAVEAVCDASFADNAIRATVFGRWYEDEEQDWSLRYLNDPDKEANRTCSIRKHLPRIAEKLGITEILAPAPTAFNGIVCGQDELRVSIPIDKEVRVHRGIEADGCMVHPGQAFGISVGGCAVIVAWRSTPASTRPYSVVAAHAGLDSLIRVPGDPAADTFKGVVNSICAALGNPEQIHTRIILPIDPWLFTHPWNDRKRGAWNRALTEHLLKVYPESLVGEPHFGRVDIAKLAAYQFLKLGVPAKHIDALPSTGTYRDRVYTTRSTDTNRVRQRTIRKRRNLVLVTRYQ